MEEVRKSGLLSDAGMQRLAAEHAQAPRTDAGDESIASFACRRIGHEAYERITEPLLTGIYGGDGSRLSVLSTFPKLRHMERQYGSLTAAMHAQRSTTAPPDMPPFLSFPGGMEELTRAAYLRIVESPRSTFVTGARVTGIAGRSPTTGQGEVRWSGKSMSFDALILALPARTTADLLDDVVPDVAREIREIAHESMATVTFAYHEADIPIEMSGTGYVRPRILGGDVAACTWASSKFSGRSPAGMRLLRVFLGGAHRRDLPLAADDVLISLARRELEQCMGITAAPSLARVTRYIDSMPQYHIGHAERMSRMERGLADAEWLSVAGNAYYGVGLPDCIATGVRAAERALALLDAPVESAYGP
jgi:oxygen-dependent protoporphyrinogen oxidase